MISPRAPVIGLPTLRLSSWASSSVWSLISAASLASDRPRLPAAHDAQPLRSSNAAWAAATARSTSSRPPCGTLAMTEPSAGSTTSNVWPSAASTGWPPTIICAVCTPARVSVVIGWALSAVGSGLDDTPGLPGRPPPRRAVAGRSGQPSPDGTAGNADPGRAGGSAVSAATIAAPMMPGVVAQRGGDDRAADGQPRDEPVRALADATADDHQVRPHQLLDPVEVLVEVGRPGLPRQPAPDPRGGRRPPLGGPPADLHLAELGVRDEDAVDEHARPDARPEGQEDDDPRLVRARPRSASRRCPPRPRR